jgi:hypothetical protein
MTVISLILILVVLPALIGYCLYSDMAGGFNLFAFSIWRGFLHRAFSGELEPGDYLVYRKPKVSPRPGPRARNVQAAENGDDYYYEVDKFWTVTSSGLYPTCWTTGGWWR